MINFMHRISGGRLLAAIAALAMTLGGLFAFRALPVDAFPDVTPSLVQVFTETEGLAPEEVERYVTYPIETAMSGLPKLKSMRSVSNFGLSVVNIYFEDGTDVYFARQVVAETFLKASATPRWGRSPPGLASSCISGWMTKPARETWLRCARSRTGSSSTNCRRCPV